ncbi:Aurachin B dehydrogenase [Hyphodiscus hymeniophilus]|uniref:Aurachin B dehydrogenase n=1 Tax=Hyphodiscus hymeniophilus TaxID=353542 RepID=A0A9P6VQ24_9HELO|nr:Aurachin B dehydrogenase [Hyphodiscus hymeniophilus]
MATKIFVTGATGYIGGDALYALYKKYPDFEYTALVRNSDSGAKVAAEYPKIHLVYGTLEDSDVLEAEAAKADIVIHTADSSDHEGAAKAIKAGLEKGHSAEKPGYWLHTSGTGILCWKDMETKTYGEAPSQQPYDDLERVEELTGLPDKAFHRDIDKIVLGASSSGVKTAIVCPPTIYGPGRGPGNKKSRQVYILARTTLEQGHASQLGKGLAEWDNVHVQDLSELFVLLVESAVSGKENPEIWGEKGYFLAENGHHSWGQVAKEVAEAAHKQGYIKTTEVSVDPPNEEKGFESLSWGLNSKGFAKRARKVLGWKPSGKILEDCIPDIVDGEAAALGLKKGYAEKVSG